MRSYNKPECSVIILEPKTVICQSLVFNNIDYTEVFEIEDVELI